MTPRGGPAEPLVELLRQLSQVVEAVSDAAYRAVPAAGMSGSIGGQVRHCLDHVAALVGSASSAAVDYDRRARGTAVETDRRSALQVIGELQAGLARVTADTLERKLRITVLLAPGRPLATESTFGRELAFVLSHTVHHEAVIAWMLRELGVDVPSGFGVAPATTEHRMAQEAALSAAGS